MYLHCNFEWTKIIYIYSKRDNSNTVMEYLCHKCSTCRKHFSVLSSFMTYHRIYNKINTTGTTSGAGTAYHSGALGFTTGFSGVRVTQSLVLCVHFVDRYLSFCTFAFGHCVVRSSSIYGFWLPPFGIFKLLQHKIWKSWKFGLFHKSNQFYCWKLKHKLFFSHLIGITCTWYIKTWV